MAAVQVVSLNLEGRLPPALILNSGKHLSSPNYSNRLIHVTLRNWFNAVDTDFSGSISAPELQQALVNGDWTGERPWSRSS